MRVLKIPDDYMYRYRDITVLVMDSEKFQMSTLQNVRVITLNITNVRITPGAINESKVE
jgi:hypothetical protein